jgi:hypothetical protein
MNQQLEFANREDLLQVNAGLISQFQKRLQAKRFRATENDSSKLAYMQALTEAVRVQNEVLASAELDEIKEEISKLKKV